MPCLAPDILTRKRRCFVLWRPAGPGPALVIGKLDPAAADRFARLVGFRIEAPGLAVDDTRFIHVDFSVGRRVVVWHRGLDDDAVVVVANFSDWGTTDPRNPSSEYVVPGWPSAPANLRWREVTRDRDVPDEWAGREPLYPWEAKVYALAPRA